MGDEGREDMLAFVIMPFEDEFEAYYRDIIKPTLQASRMDIKALQDLWHLTDMSKWIGDISNQHLLSKFTADAVTYKQIPDQCFWAY